jgi:glycosyltransferase involved in cell wall biosynthesis
MPLPEEPEISVLIPAFNEEALLPKVLGCVHASFAALPFDSYEIVVCDNNSTDNTASAASEAGARVVFEPHNQIARARNTAARAAAGKWFIFLDADTFLTPELLRETIRCFNSGEVCAGGSVLRFDREGLSLFATSMTWLWNKISAVFGLAAGSYIFCYKTAWEETGGFDEEIYAGEEIFFSHRLKKWAKSKRMKFKVLTIAPVVTSARKMDWYGTRGLMLAVALMFRPGSIRNREMCDLWYKRPSAPAPDPPAS